jgi:hypothetical protein
VVLRCVTCRLCVINRYKFVEKERAEASKEEKEEMSLLLVRPNKTIKNIKHMPLTTEQLLMKMKPEEHGEDFWVLSIVMDDPQFPTYDQRFSFMERYRQAVRSCSAALDSLFREGRKVPELRIGATSVGISCSSVTMTCSTPCAFSAATLV